MKLNKPVTRPQSSEVPREQKGDRYLTLPLAEPSGNDIATFRRLLKLLGESRTPNIAQMERLQHDLKLAIKAKKLEASRDQKNT